MKTIFNFIIVFALGVASHQAIAQCGTRPSATNSPSGCSGIEVTMSAQSTGFGDGLTIIHHWYTTETGGTAFANPQAMQPYPGAAAYVSTYTTSSLTVTTTYWVSASCNYSNESTTRRAVTFTLTSPGSISIGVSVQPTLCIGDPITLTPQNCSGCSWTAGTSGTGPKTVSPGTATTYTVSGQELVCGTNASASVTVNVSAKVGQVSAPSGGTTSFCQGTLSTSNYTASATNASSYQWGLSPGGAGSINGSGTVTWNSGFSGTATVSITAFSGQYCSYTTTNSTNVNVHPAQSQPSVSSPVSVQYSTSPTLTASGAGSGVTYRWYDSGNSLVGTGNTFATGALNTASSYTYYVTKYNSTTGCETPYTSKATIVANLFVPDPLHPVATVNTCFDKTLTLNTPPSNVTWYMQTASNGTSTATPLGTQYVVTSTGTYFIRARANTLAMWSNAIQLSIPASTVNPVDIQLSSYDASNHDVRATHLIKLLPGVTVSPGQSFSAKIEITPECNEWINWTETLVYDKNENVVGDSRIYLDGNGSPIQSTTKDFVSGKMLVSQPLFNNLHAPVGATLPAPILENGFIYKNEFTSDQGGNRYSHDDFDLRTTTNVAGSGEVNYPKQMGTQPGTVGWYYSTNNDIEPKTPTTQYPYSRQFVPEGPDPVTSTSAGPGDAFRMGSTHEVKSARSLITSGELDHYYAIRPLFVFTPPPGDNKLSVNTYSTTGFVGSGVSVSASNGYIDVLATTTGGTPGVMVGGVIGVTAGKKYVLSVRGFVPTSEPQAFLFVKANGGADIMWPGSALPVTNEDWVSSIFTVPGGVTQINVGVRYNNSHVNGSSNFLIGAITLKEATPSLTGYKYITTDGNGKRAASFADADGRSIASAVITAGGGPPYTYDYWDYTFYNDQGAVVATVTPKDVNTGSFSIPTATTHKYDHLGQLIEITSPDEGTSRFVYSTDGKIRFSENQVQRDASPKRFSYTNYDKLGRLIESGVYASNGTNPYVFEPHSTSSPGTYSVLNIVDHAGFSGVSRTVDTVRCTEYSYLTYDVAGSGSPDTQEYLYGEVSKTQNENVSTWYSYDEYGQIKWTIQAISGLGNKRIDYTYNFFGEVTEIGYQTGVSGDKFYHHYEYDVNGRLTQVYTSFDGTNMTLQAKYIYYLHGPLKRVELADNLQGIDYVYTIDGSLKSINHSDPSKDPGGDGSNGFSADVFGQMLNYHDNDYTGAGYSAGGVTASGVDNQFNGLIRYNSWFTPVDNPSAKKVYGYAYDALYRLQNAQYSSLAGTAGAYTASFSNGAYREGISGYDKNGNISGLIRNNKAGAATTYTYNYTNPAKNSLTSVSGGPNTVSYSYNAIGEMTQQTEGSVTTKVFYNAYGLVNEIRDGGDQPVLKYYYDDRGNKVKKVNYASGVPSRTTFYISDASGNVVAIYDDASGSQAKKEVPVYGAGRIAVYKPVPNAWFYELTDNLGNVRAVIGPPKTKIYTATMESENSATENTQFKNIAPRSTWVNPTVTPPAPAGNEAVILNNSRVAGPGIVLKVAPGDVISAEVYAYYEGCSNCASTQSVATIVTSVAGAFGGAVNGLGESGKIYNAINGALTGGFGGGAGSGNNALPAGYLNMITFNNNMDVPNPAELPMAATMMSTAANMQKEKLTIGPITIPTPGYVYIYVNDNSASSTQVFFDDLKVTHVHSPSVAGADYYPFGLTMSDREIREEPYRFGYQGQYSEEDSVTGWNEFDLRMYDARFGRWISPDPYGQFASPYVGMGNNPVSGTDPDGGWCPECLQEFLDAGGKFLDEVVVTASRGAEVVGKVGLQTLSGLARTGTQVNYHLNGFNHTISGGLIPLMSPPNANAAEAQRFGSEETVIAVQLVTSMMRMGPPRPMPGGRPAVATPNGSVPITLRVSAPTVNAARVHNVNMTSDGFKKPKSNLSGKEGAKDVPDWAKGNRPKLNENGHSFARRLLDEKYGKGNYETGPSSEFSKIKKWGDRAFE